VAAAADAKPWATEVQHRCIRFHVERQGLAEMHVDSPELGVFRSRWRASGRRASVVVPSCGGPRLRRCLETVLGRTSYPDFEVVVVATDEVHDAVRAIVDRFGDQRLRVARADSPFNYSRANNLGAAVAEGEVLVFLNDDTEVVEPGWLEELVRWADQPGVGAVGARLLYPDGTVQHAGMYVGLEGHASHLFRGAPGRHEWTVFGSPESYRDLLALTGACMAVNRDAFAAAGGFDERYELCYSDIDLCLRLADSGRRVVYTPYATLIHHEGASRGLHFPAADVLTASVEMLPLVALGDPFLSPNLAQDVPRPAIARRDRPEDRVVLIRRITEDFGVRDALDRALEGELLGATSAWSRYRELLGRARGLRADTRPRRGPAPSVAGLRLLMTLHDLSRSGAPMVALRLARQLTARGHAITVASPKAGPLREAFEAAGAAVAVDPLFLEAPHAVADEIADHDALLAHTLLSWRTVLTAGARGVPNLWLVHEGSFATRYLRELPSAVRALALADAVVFPSHATLPFFAGYDAGNQHVAVYGLEPPSLTGAVPADDGPVRAVVVAGLEPRKGQDVLLEAVGRLPRGSVEVTLIGRELVSPYAERVCGGLARLPGSRWLGEMPWVVAMARMAAADVLVCPSLDETGPLVVMEAMGLGRAVVTTRVGAMPEVVEDGVSGLLVDVGDAGQLAGALRRLVDDRGLLRRLGEGARRRASERLSIERYGAEVEALVRTAVAARRRS